MVEWVARMVDGLTYDRLIGVPSSSKPAILGLFGWWWGGFRFSVARGRCRVRNHDEKIKDMSESVLPSTRRRSARMDRRRAHKRHRTRQRDVLSGFRGATDQDEYSAAFPDRRRCHDVTGVVWARRSADKVGSLNRWARMRVERDPQLRAAPVSAQVGHFAHLLPDTLIGRHAAQHIEITLRPREGSIYLRPRHAALKAQTQRLREEERIAADLRVILGFGEHSQLNAALRDGYRQRAPVGSGGAQHFPPPNRLVLGSHDIEDFAAAAVDHGWISQLVRDFAARPRCRALDREPS